MEKKIFIGLMGLTIFIVLMVQSVSAFGFTYSSSQPFSLKTLYYDLQDYKEELKFNNCLDKDKKFNTINLACKKNYVISSFTNIKYLDEDLIIKYG